MLHFGAIMCGDACGSMGGIAVSDQPLKPAPASDDALQNADSIFMEIASRLGLEFTGQPLKETYQAQDGMFEKVFENVVLYADPLNPTQIKLRPLPNILGIPADPPVPPSGVQGTYFYQTGDNLGYNVPEIFMDYVTLHGTMEISGPPITELHAILNDYSRQCFTNHCLEYHANAQRGRDTSTARHCSPALGQISYSPSCLRPRRPRSAIKWCGRRVRRSTN